MLAAHKTHEAKDGEFEETTATLETSEEEKTDTAATIITPVADDEAEVVTPEVVLLDQPTTENEAGDNLAPSDVDTTAEVEAP